MGKHARIGLLLGASACLLAVDGRLGDRGTERAREPSAGKLASSLAACPAAAAHSAAGPLDRLEAT